MDNETELLAILDKMLALTAHRDAFSSSEVSDFCLDMRNTIVREADPDPVLETV